MIIYTFQPNSENYKKTMTININYKKNNTNKISSNLVLFSNDKFDTKGFNRFLSKSEFSYVNDLLKTSDLKKNMFVFEVNSKKKIVLISIKKKLKNIGYRKFRCGILWKDKLW